MLTLTVICASTLGGPVEAVESDDSLNTIGIKLLELPVDRQDDPRARRYIIDHLPPGATIQRKVEIANRTEKRRQVQVYAAAATVDGEEFSFAEGRTANELSSWTSLGVPDLDLKPGQKKPAIVTIRVPENASTGERYAVIWASTTSDPVPGAVTKINRVGIRVYLDIGPGGEPSTDFRIDEFTASRNPDGQPSLRVGVTNTGGRAVDLSGNLLLTHERDEIKAGPFSVVEGTTLAPGQTGNVAIAVSRRLDNGPWRAELTLVSGLVQRTAATTVTFPDPGGPPTTFKPGTTHLLLAGSGAAGLVILAALFVMIRRSRLRTSQPGQPVRRH
ncbi:hypothetical protein O7626_11205 [Micromonospora sp. WMMD1102]|uniref:hypothetical protein n=1 Tax=Micromonospora sp. WMMD1102 TaxID=3016105 RepID=UPI002414D728|nr:hypothetical protein [Micromonospora sp. WMMD1102]MDG4786489.1 hypothetical protein [Micromonospora sp. WMMD1102]